MSLKLVLWLKIKSLDITVSTPNADDYQKITSRMTTMSFMRLADLCNTRHDGTCEWIFDNDTYTQWLFGLCRTLYCVGPGIYPLQIQGYIRLDIKAETNETNSGRWKDISRVSQTEKKKKKVQL